jgi:hypothetical protein
MIATLMFYFIIYICPKQQSFPFLQNEGQFLHISSYDTLIAAAAFSGLALKSSAID